LISLNYRNSIGDWRFRQLAAFAKNPYNALSARAPVCGADLKLLAALLRKNRRKRATKVAWRVFSPPVHGSMANTRIAIDTPTPLGRQLKQNENFAAWELQNSCELRVP
jgi:hypothetical protein